MGFPLALLRASICPTIYTVILLHHARNPHRLPRLLPSLWPITATTLAKPLLPRSTLASFRLGRLVQRLQTATITEYDTLAEARALLVGHIDTLPQLLDLEANLERQHTHAPLARLRAALTLANLLWLISIAGLGATFWPTLKLLLGRVLASASEWFVRVVLPALVWMHRIGVFETLAYAACVLIVAQAARYLQPFGVGVPGSYVALTAFVGALLAFWYTMHLHADGYVKVTDPVEATLMGAENLNGLLWGVFQVCAVVPLAVVHESELLGFIGAIAMMNVLNNVVSVSTLSMIGFDMSETADYLTVSSGILVAIFVAARLVGGAKFAWLKPMHLGVMVVGNVGFFTGLLIRASKYYKEEHSGYVFAQIHIVVSLVAAVTLGKLFDIASLSSTGIIFGTLYVVEKFEELPWGQAAIVAWFGTFGLLYAAAGYVRTHPELLKNLIDGRGLLSGD